MEQFFFSKSDKIVLKNCSFSYIQKNCTFCFQTNKELFFVVKYFMELFFPVNYFMELCDEVELVYQRLRVFSGSKKRLPTGGCRGLDFGNAPFGVAGFPSFSAFSHLRKPVHLPHALRGWIL